MLLSIGLMHLLASAEIVITQILMSVLKKDWELSEFQVMLLPFTNYIGLLFGAMTCSFVSNYTGRKNLLIVFAFL
jgi:fucose permease